MAKGSLLHGVSAVPGESILQNIGKKIVKKLRLSGMSGTTRRILIEREKIGPTLGIILQGGQSS